MTRPIEPPTQDIAHIDTVLAVPVVERGSVPSLSRSGSISFFNKESRHFLQVVFWQKMRGRTGVKHSAMNMEVVIRRGLRIVKSTPAVKSRTVRGITLQENRTIAKTALGVTSHGVVVSKAPPPTRTTIVLVLGLDTMPESKPTTMIALKLSNTWKGLVTNARLKKVAKTTINTTGTFQTGIAKCISLIIIVRTTMQPSFKSLDLCDLTVTWNLNLCRRLQFLVLTPRTDQLHYKQKKGLRHTTRWNLRERQKIFARYVRDCERPVPDHRQSRW